MVHIVKLFRLSTKKLWAFSLAALAVILYVLYIQFSGIAHANTTYTFSGSLRDQNNTSIYGIDIILRDTQNNTYYGETASDGSFSIAVDPGIYSLKIVNNTWLSGPGRIVKFSIAQPISTPSIDLTAGDVAQDLTLPLGSVNFTVYNEQGYGSSNAMVTSDANPSDTISVSLYPGSTEAVHDGPTHSNSIGPNSDGTGYFKAVVGTTFVPGSIVVNWKNSVRVSSNSTPITVVNSATNVDLPNTPPPRNTFSGTFKDSTGAPVDKVRIYLRDAYNNQVSTTTATDGSFSIAVQPGLYSMNMQRSDSSGVGTFILEQPTINPTIDLSSESIAQNLTLPVGIVNFVAYNAAGDHVEMWADISAKGYGTTPVSLYPNGHNFELGRVTLSARGTYEGIGTFKAIVGSRYAGTGYTDGVCSHHNTDPIHCNKNPLVIGTNNLILSP